MAHQHSNLTHRPAENQPVPSRADQVSNVRIQCVKAELFLSIIFYINIRLMTNDHFSFLTPYKIF